MTTSKELTTEQLVDILNETPDVKNIRHDKSNVFTFVKEYNVVEGEQRVPNYKIYYDYVKKWQTRGKKISKVGFFRAFRRAFKMVRTGQGRYYLILEGVFDVSKEALNEAKEYDKRYNTRIKKKAQQKTKGKVSSTPEEIQSEDETGLHRV